MEGTENPPLKYPTSSMAFLPFRAPVSIIAILACFLAGNSSEGIKTNTCYIY